MKKCFKCKKSQPLTEFYKHKGMADGHLNKCKTCAKNDAKRTRDDNITYYRAYDRLRGNRQPEGYHAEYRKKYPNKYRATNMVNNAIRDGRLFPEPCCECGSEDSPHGHHDDYAKPLNVRWLCAACHSQWHVKHGEAKNST